jgi:hypothetical protein
VIAAPPPPPPPPPEVIAAPPPEHVSAPPPAMELEEVHDEAVAFGVVSTNPVLPASAAVVTIEGAVPKATGTTFGDLIEASLSLSL